MSEKSQQLLLGNSVVPPEELDDINDEMGEHIHDALFSSNVTDIADSIGDLDFKNVYLTLVPELEIENIENKRKFVKNLLSKVRNVYDFEFPERPDMETDYQLEEIIKFVEFVEYDHIRFLSYVWRFLKQDLMKIDIWEYCKANDMKIIKEVEEQVDTHPQPELISKFLRTYYKDKFIEWFATNSEQSKVEISLEIFESEGKLNG